MIRLLYVGLFALIIVILMICALIARRSVRPIGKRVCLLCFSLIPPVLGNLIIVASEQRALTLVGCYFYYIGMDFILLALIAFSKEYYRVQNGKQQRVPVLVYLILAADLVQMALNPVFGHAFTLQEITVYNAPYYLMVPLWGQVFHRIACYGVLGLIMLSYFMLMIRMPKISRERFTVIFLSMLAGSLWQTFYIFSRTPIDRSMIGFALFGVMIFYFSIYYHPVRLLDRLLANIVSDLKVAVFLFGPIGKCIWANEPARKLSGCVGEDYDGAGAALREHFGVLEELPEKTNVEFSLGAGEDARYYKLDRSSIFDENGKKLGFYVNVINCTAEKKQVMQELYAAKHDVLTGLYTKEYLFQKIRERLQRHELKDYFIAYIDVRNFKIVNDVFGKDFGDQALMQIADWIRKYSDETCIYGRMSGDSFGSCLPKKSFIPHVVEQDLAGFVVKRGSAVHRLVIHIGFCDIGDEDQDVSILFDRAHLALSSIKDDFKTHVAFYDSRLRERVRWNQEISAQLGDAILKNEIFPYLQPIADREGRIVGAEALARWIHPTHGFMPPGNFIPLFEENGMIADLDRHIWRAACRILADWKETHPELFLSVNVSPRDFYLTDVLTDITGMVEEYAVDPKKLRIEVTETSMMNDTDDRMRILDEFRRRGFILEMDDFGSGYSSLNMLKDMPVDVLKIDMKFLGRSKDESRANTIVKNVIRLSEDLGIMSLTEGVETMDQFHMLAEMGCELFQGYYFAKPVPLAEFDQMLISG